VPTATDAQPTTVDITATGDGSAPDIDVSAPGENSDVTVKTTGPSDLSVDLDSHHSTDASGAQITTSASQSSSAPNGSTSVSEVSVSHASGPEVAKGSTNPWTQVENFDLDAPDVPDVTRGKVPALPQDGF
jgi:hypothetical protein